MRTVGIITTSVVALIVLAAIITAVVSIPDLQRYLKMRKM